MQIQQESEHRLHLMTSSSHLGVVDAIYCTEEPKCVWHYTGDDEDYCDEDENLYALIERVGNHYGCY